MSLSSACRNLELIGFHLVVDKAREKARPELQVAKHKRPCAFLRVGVVVRGEMAVPAGARRRAYEYFLRFRNHSVSMIIMVHVIAGSIVSMRCSSN